MPFQIEDIDLPSLLEFYERKVSEIKKKIDPLTDELNRASMNVMKLRNRLKLPELSINGIDKSGNGVEVIDMEFDEEWSWWDKAKYALGQAKRTLTSAEIVDSVIAYQPSLKDNRGFVMANLSAVLGQKAKIGTEITRKRNKLGQWTYYLPEWNQKTPLMEGALN